MPTQDAWVSGPIDFPEDFSLACVRIVAKKDGGEDLTLTDPPLEDAVRDMYRLGVTARVSP